MGRKRKTGSQTLNAYEQDIDCFPMFGASEREHFDYAYSNARDRGLNHSNAEQIAREQVLRARKPAWTPGELF